MTPHSWKHCGFVVSELMTRIKQSGFEPWLGTKCCVLGQDTFLAVSLFTHVYKIMDTGTFNAGKLNVTLQWTSIPFRGEEKYS